MSVTLAPVPLSTLVTWLSTQHRSDFAQSLVRYYRRNGRLSERQEAAAQNMYAKAHPVQVDPEIVGEACANDCHDYCDHGNEDEGRMVAAEIAATEPMTPGFYMIETTVYKVKRSQAGNLYAVRRTETGWEYAPGAIRNLTVAHKITPEVAAEHGIATGICIFCNAELDDADGLGKRVGVGPVCCRKHLGMTQRQLAERLGV